MHSPRRVCFWIAWLNDWSTPRRPRYVAVFYYVVCPKTVEEKVAGQQYRPTTVELKALGVESTQSSLPMPRLLQIDNIEKTNHNAKSQCFRAHKVNSMKQMIYNRFYLHIESKAMTLWKHFQHFVCISNNGHPYIFVGSNMLACQICQCFFVGQWMDWPSHPHHSWERWKVGATSRRSTQAWWVLACGFGDVTAGWSLVGWFNQCFLFVSFTKSLIGLASVFWFQQKLENT